MAMITIRNLVKSFGDLVAVKDLNMDIVQGEIYGILGPNGAGKTTTVRMLCGIAHPTSGTAHVKGLDIVKDSVAVRRILGIVPQVNTLDRELSVRENLIYHSKLHGMPKEKYLARVQEVLEFVQLEKKIDEMPLTLSGGMKRRFTIAKALLHDPEVLFLDEPSTGLDPQARQTVWKKILELKQRGKTILLTTHYMEEAERLCDRVGIIDEGKLIREGSPDHLKSLVGLELPIKVKFTTEPDMAVLLSDPMVTSHQTKYGKHLFHTSDREKFIRLLLDNFGPSIGSMDMPEPSLEDVFLELTGRDMKE